jgi:hypothetical protein
MASFLVPTRLVEGGPALKETSKGLQRGDACISKIKTLEDDQLRGSPHKTMPGFSNKWTHAKRITTIAGRAHP